jgi:hypothetical protein
LHARVRAERLAVHNTRRARMGGLGDELLARSRVSAVAALPLSGLDIGYQPGSRCQTCFREVIEITF